MNKLIEIQYRLEKYKEKYPNIIEVWETVIASRMNLIDITLKECNKVIELIGPERILKRIKEASEL